MQSRGTVKSLSEEASKPPPLPNAPSPCQYAVFALNKSPSGLVVTAVQGGRLPLCGSVRLPGALQRNTNSGS